MKTRVSLLMVFALLAALAVFAADDSLGQAAPRDQGTIIYVDVDATGANDGSSWQNAYSSLQPALDDAVAGDQIWVAAGTYKPIYESLPGNPRSATFQLKNGVALYGGFDPSVGDTEWADRDWTANVTILSGDRGTAGNPYDNSYHVFYHPAALALDASAVLDGFTITAGVANGGGVLSQGGGMYNDGCSPTVMHCTFAGNYANVGGGMYNGASSPTVTDCAFSENSASLGGGMANYNSSWPSLTNCTFSDNEAQNGAGMLNDHSSPEVTGCTFADNEAVNGSGGGMYNYTGSSPILTNCMFVGNSAFSMGGGIVNYNANAPVVTNCTFSGNSANTGGGIYDRSSLLTVTNSILWADTPDEISVHGTAPPVVTFSDVQGADVYPGTGNINADPVFEDAAMQDLDLLEGSPCIDAGTNDAPNLPATDFEGDPRIWDGDSDGTATADMGADEFAFHTLALHMAGNGSGTVEQTPEGTRLAHGTLVTLTATADNGSSFTGWSGDAVGTDNPVALTMDMDKVVTATFELEMDTHTLTVSYAGNGSGLVSLDPPGGLYQPGTIVTLTAVADPGSSFAGWSGDVVGTDNPIALTMDMDKEVTATFELEMDTHMLTISYAGNGTGLVSLDPPGGLYEHGTTVTLTAEADPGSSFAGWSGDVAGTANPVALTMDADKAVTATFVTYRIHVPLVAKHAP